MNSFLDIIQGEIVTEFLQLDRLAEAYNYLAVILFIDLLRLRTGQ